MTKRSAAAIATLHPTVARKAEALWTLANQALAGTGVRLEIIEGYRSPERQDELYALKRTRAKAWQSWHQYGLAFDTGLFEERNYIDETAPRWAAMYHKAVASLARQIGLECGADFRRYPDPPHYQDRLGIPNTSNAHVRMRVAGGNYKDIGLAQKKRKTP